MECTTKLQTSQKTEASEIIENKEITKLEINDNYDNEARKYRKYLAQQEALRRLERIKSNVRAEFRL